MLRRLLLILGTILLLSVLNQFIELAFSVIVSASMVAAFSGEHYFCKRHNLVVK